MSGVLVDSNVLIDIMTEDPIWQDWSEAALERAANRSRLVINAVIYGEIAVHWSKMEELDVELSEDAIEREDIPYPAAFLAGKSFVAYRQRGGLKRSPLPDFLIGAHAAVSGYRLLTRDAARYRTYFPQLALIAPDRPPSPS